MNLEKYTKNAQEAVLASQNLAVSEGNQEIECEHLHLALMRQKDGLISKLVKNMGADSAGITAELEQEVAKLPKVSGGPDGMYLSMKLNNLFMKAEKEAGNFKDEYVSVEHLYLALLDTRGIPSGKILANHGAHTGIRARA